MKVADGKKKDANTAAKTAATEDLNYKYNLQINRALMLDFQYECKRHNTDAATELRAFVAKKLEAWAKK